MSESELLTVPQYFLRTCQAFPTRLAQRFNPDLYHGDNQGSFTYQKLQERVENIACGLLRLGIDGQERAAIMSPSGPYWTHIDLALSNLGATSVAIFPTLSVQEVVHIVNDSGCSVLFVGDESLLDRVKNGLSEMPGLKTIIVMDTGFRSGKGGVGLREIIERGSEKGSELHEAYGKRRDAVGLDDVYTILYTSGTSGVSKGVPLTYRCAATRLVGARKFFREHGMVINEEDVTLCFLPLAHIFDRGSCQLLALAQGACIAYADKPGTLLADIRKYHPTWFNCVPRLYEKIYITFQQQMMKSPIKKRLFDWALRVGTRALAYRTDVQGRINMSPDFDLEAKLPLLLRIQYRLADKLFVRVRALFGERFRFSFSASAGISPDLLRFYYTVGLPVVEGYGSTESFNACLLNPIDACKPGSVGVEVFGSVARVAVDGELEISGGGIFKGYLKPQDSENCFTSDGWFKTGDLVIKDDDGYYRIIDRKKAILCTSTGKNVAPAKLEAQFATSMVIEQTFFIGDERPFIAALLIPNFNYFIGLFEREGIPYDKSRLKFATATGVRICMEVGEDFTAQPLLRTLIQQDVLAANAKLESFEAIKQYTILNKRFAEENGQLTPTQKNKKRAILKDYAAEINRMYLADQKKSQHALEQIHE